MRAIAKRRHPLWCTMIRTLIAALVIGLPPAVNALDPPPSGGEGKHLFILSGQSNMAGLRPQESFTPAVVAAFGKSEVIVVKDAHGGQPDPSAGIRSGSRPKGTRPRTTAIFTNAC